MTETLSRITENISVVFFFRQVLVILALFIVGFIVIYRIGNDKRRENKIALELMFLLAFPVGISVYSLSGMLLLILNIQYCTILITIACVCFLLTVILTTKKDVSVKEYIICNYKKIAIYCVCTVILILISVSGIISVGYSNDSMYYYSAYPHEIVNNGYFSYKFDTFLTDAGQATAVINTLPFLFGFNETFGIHSFFNVNYIIFFFYVIYNQAAVLNNKKLQIIIPVLSVLLLITSMPFVIISKWILANMYFMETMFYVLYLNHEFKNDRIMIWIRVILIVMLSFIRIEGALFAGLLCLTYLIQKDAEKREVLLLTIPTMILQGLYFIRIFLTMKISAAYTFMTWQKALIAIIYLIAIAFYGIVMAKDSVLPYIKNKISWLTPGIVIIFGLICVNATLCVYKPSQYISNVKVFIGNVTGQSGWGFFAAIVVSLILLMPKIKIDDNYYDIFVIGFILISFAACFARGDGLRVDLSDSSNRVMLQIVPFVIYALTYRYIKSIDNRKCDANE